MINKWDAGYFLYSDCNLNALQLGIVGIKLLIKGASRMIYSQTLIWRFFINTVIHTPSRMVNAKLH